MAITKKLAELLLRHAHADAATINRLDEICAAVASAFAPCLPEERKALLDELQRNVAAHLQHLDDPAVPTETNGFPYEKVPPAVRAWALEQFSEEEIVGGLREVRETGGLELSDFIHELEQIADSDA
jgi:hypothetical protein